MAGPVITPTTTSWWHSVRQACTQAVAHAVASAQAADLQARIAQMQALLAQPEVHADPETEHLYLVHLASLQQQLAQLQRQQRGQA